MNPPNTRREFLQATLAGATALGLGDIVAAQQDDAKGLPTRPLGKTGQRICILGLGGWHIGAVKDEKEAIQIMHAAIDEGLTFFDNAWDYHDGKSEELIRRLRPLIAEGLSAAIYTQTTDVEVEVNGFMTYDRAVIKLDPVKTVALHKSLFGPPQKEVALAPTSHTTAQSWRYTFEKPADGWEQAAFDDASTAIRSRSSASLRRVTSVSVQTMPRSVPASQAIAVTV